MTGSIFLQAFIYLVAAVIAVPLARRLGLGSALGYLLAGVLSMMVTPLLVIVYERWLRPLFVDCVAAYARR